MAYVIVWENNTQGHQKVKGQTWPGHVAMNIGDLFKQEDPFDEYVSFCPSRQETRTRTAYLPNMVLRSGGNLAWQNEGDVTLKESVTVRAEGETLGVTDVFSKSQKGVRGTSIIDDILTEGYLPDHVIELATTEEKERNMRSAWSTVRGYMQGSKSKGKYAYRALRRNCATIVSRILHAGGLYAKKWAVDCNWVWTPADVAKLARGAGGTNVTWNDFLAVLKIGAITAADFGGITEARSSRYCTTGAPCHS